MKSLQNIRKQLNVTLPNDLYLEWLSSLTNKRNKSIV